MLVTKGAVTPDAFLPIQEIEMAKTPSGNKAAPTAVSKVPAKPAKPAAGKVATPAKSAPAKKGK